VKFAEIKGITGGENLKPLHIDSEVLKCGDQMGFVTPVVHTLTYGNRSFEKPWIFLTSIYFFSLSFAITENLKVDFNLRFMKFLISV